MADSLSRADAPAGPLTPVEFHGATLITTIIDGVPYVALKPICEAIGLQWEGQLQRIKRHAVLCAGMCVTRMPSPGGDQQTTMLRLSLLNGWLFGVSVGRVRPELRERLTQYQAECFDVLARHFGAAPRQAAQAPAAPALPAPDGIDVRALLLSGQSEPVALSPAHQALINSRAWVLAGEAYELARQHLERRVAYRSLPGRRNDPVGTQVADIVAATTLGNALAHEYHTQIEQLLSSARVFKLLAGDTFDALQALVDQRAGQGGGAAGVGKDI